MRFAIAMLAWIALVSHVQAMSFNEAVRKCYADGRNLCPNLGHGSKMQDCLNQNFKHLSTDCQGIVMRLNQGERISFF